MISTSRITNNIVLPLLVGEFSMLPFDLNTLQYLPNEFKPIAEQMLSNIKGVKGEGYFTIHGSILKKGESHRRPGPHVDGNYDKRIYSWGGGGWKVGLNSGPKLNTEEHNRLYNTSSGGIILCSNFESCIGWHGEFNDLPRVGGDCSHIELNDSFLLEKNKVYYGNNHFIHESIPVSEDTHRVFCRITLPIDHIYS